MSRFPPFPAQTAGLPNNGELSATLDRYNSWSPSRRLGSNSRGWGTYFPITVKIRGAEDSSGRLASRRVALVEESPIIRLALEEAFRHAGAHLVPHTDAEIGVAAIGLGVTIDPALDLLVDGLRRRGTRFLFYGGPDVDFDAILRRWPECIIVPKPRSLNDVIEAVAALFRPAGRTIRGHQNQQNGDQRHRYECRLVDWQSRIIVSIWMECANDVEAIDRAAAETERFHGDSRVAGYELRQGMVRIVLMLW